MSSVKTQSRYDASRHMNYISTAAFNTVFFTYTYVQPAPGNSFAGYGTLTAVSGATSVNCPVGRILRATNKKLYPDAAGLPTTGANAVADRTPLVGVFDYHSGLSGFIDPNNSVFALYNGDKPIDSIDGADSNGHNTHKGMSVYTGGNVTASGSVTAGGQLRSSTSTALSAVAVTTGSATLARDIDPTLGQVFTLSVQATGGTNSIQLTQTTASASGSIVYLVVTLTGSHTTAISLSGGTNIKMATQALGTAASKVWTFTFVSDGTNLNQIAAAAGPY